MNKRNKKTKLNFELNNSTRNLVLVCIFTTFVAISIWGYYFLAVRNGDNLLPSTGGIFPGTNSVQKFDLKFNQKEVELPFNEESVVILMLDGSLEDIVSSKVVLKYDPNIIEVVDQSESTLFDFYIGNAIDKTQGLINLSGALTETSSAKTGIFSQLTLKRIADGETIISLLGDDEENAGQIQFSKAITTYGFSYPISSQQLRLL
ncbi:hypothetical protein KC669_00835 [Candidatus Dojkabacteria bacterium]|uniref:Cohesin domain-containing protein n=1 Tax=Candidatus Dojkabacteria bacterium TaxID=2099670 RepID=A0A955LA88_9BACT|nr:hypothetical protein [Candidatus Dojkabacteria bacterium]